ncbi:MAG: transposase, partial [Syntrophothermus sp.]|uniref:transposase n=1 Tax=Syntrophothermus sp. TaxID=2736299 RepID=UPI00257B7073
NAQLRWECGVRGAVPPSWVFSRFLKKLLAETDAIGELFERLAAETMSLMPDFGKTLAIDGKVIRSHGKPLKKGAVNTADGRRETDADWTAKVYTGQRADGTTWQKTIWQFGYKLHLLVDAQYELPVAYSVSRASESESPQAHKLLANIKQRQPLLLERCEVMLADRGYDDAKLLSALWDEHEIKPVIDIRNCWQDGEQTHLMPGTQNIVYDYRGNVYCHCPDTAKRLSMAYGGFEKKRNTLKYRCPAREYALKCKGSARCKWGSGIRIKLDTDRRIFVPIARSSYKWEREYKKRTAVERVNSRLDVSFGFERHYIRGLKKMRARVGLALCVMLAMAVGRLRSRQKHLMRSLVVA